MASYITVTVNPAWNRISRVLARDGDRGVEVELARCVVGGSGIVCARVLSRLGADVVATGLLGGVRGREIRRSLEEEGLRVRFLEVEGESRTTNVYVGPEPGQEVEFKEQGPAPRAEVADRLLAHLRDLVSADSRVLLCGSTPPATPVDLYARLVEGLHEAGAAACVDAEANQMPEVLRASPELAKCNGVEAAKLLGTAIEGERQAAAAAFEMTRSGAAVAMVSLGPRGAVLAHAGRPRVLWADAPRIETVNTAGSGDSLLASYVWARQRGLDEAAALRMGVAAGAANAMGLGAGLFDPAVAERLAGEIEVVPIPVDG